MTHKTVKFDSETKYVKDFLELPKMLYSKKTLTQNEKEEKELLLSTHVLSKYFKLTKFLVYKDKVVAARCAVTIYLGDDNAYIGFFECIDDAACARLLFDAAKEFVIEQGCKKIIGPVDASFWIKYRLKVNLFDKRPYVSEPYNKEYYLKLFLDNGYLVAENYASNIYKKQASSGYEHEKSKERFKKYTEKNYVIVSPKLKDWDKTISEIYRLITELYKDFPIFKMISEEDFLKHYESFKYILDLSMVKMTYFEGEAVGFFLGVPDYGNALYGKISIRTLIRIFFKKMRSSNYIMLYMGVSKKHRGLGLAMISTIINNVNRKKATAVGALIKEGKVTGGYGTELIDSKYRYVLLEYSLTDQSQG